MSLMGTILSYPTDFRAEAATASSVALAGLGISPDAEDLTRCGLSVCVPVAGNPGEIRSKVRRILLCAFTGTFALAGCGAFMIYTALHPIIISANRTLSFPLFVGIAVLGLGWLGICSAVNIEHLVARSMLRKRHAALPGFLPTEKSVMVNIENPRTCQQVKVVVDDMTLMHCDSVKQLVVLEGIFYRYVVHARDLVSCEIYQPRSVRFVVIGFRVAESEQVLLLAMSYNGALIELRRQLSFNRLRPPLAAMLERTFNIEIGATQISPIDSGGQF